MDFESKQKIGIIIQKHILSTKIGYVIDLMKSNKPKCEPINDTPADTNDVVYIYTTQTYNTSEPKVDEKEVKVSGIREIH